MYKRLSLTFIILGLSLFSKPDLLGADSANDSRLTTSLSSSVERAFSILRQHDQTEYRATTEVMDAARLIFLSEGVELVGWTQKKVLEKLGPPIRKWEGDRLIWFYEYHNGEMGVMPALYFDEEKKRISQVKLRPTE